MEATFEKVEKRKGTSFSVVSYTNPYFAAPLHIHPEYELILIEEGKGLSFVGDSIQDLSPGDFMLIGKNLPICGSAQTNTTRTPDWFHGLSIPSLMTGSFPPAYTTFPNWRIFIPS